MYSLQNKHMRWLTWTPSRCGWQPSSSIRQQWCRGDCAKCFILAGIVLMWQWTRKILMLPTVSNNSVQYRVCGTGVHSYKYDWNDAIQSLTIAKVSIITITHLWQGIYRITWALKIWCNIIYICIYIYIYIRDKKPYDGIALWKQ